MGKILLHVYILDECHNIMTNKWKCYLLKLKNKICHLAYYIHLVVKCIKSVYFHFLCYSFVETIFKMELNTLTKYKDSLTFKFEHDVNARYNIMPV